MILRTNDAVSDLLLERRLRNLRKALVKQTWPTFEQQLKGDAPATTADKAAEPTAVVWGDISGDLSAQTDLDGALDTLTSAASAAAGAAVWGGVTGTLSAQTDLSTALTTARLSPPMAPQVPMKPAAGVVVGNLLTGALTTSALAQDRMDIAPFVSQYGFACDTAYVSISTAVNPSTCRVVIYDADADGRPTTALATSDTIDSGSNATASVAFSYTFVAGKLYWVGVWASAAITVRSAQTYVSQPISWTTAATPVRQHVLRQSTAYGASAPNWTYASGQHTSANAPLVLFKVA